MTPEEFALQLLPGEIAAVTNPLAAKQAENWKKEMVLIVVMVVVIISVVVLVDFKK